MAIPSREIGWDEKTNMYWHISKQFERLIELAYKFVISSTTTTTTITPTTSTTSSTTTTTTITPTTSTTSSTTTTTTIVPTTTTTTIAPTTTTTTTVPTTTTTTTTEIPTYYISNAGDDAADGLTEGTAWATLAYAETHATTAGSIIALKKGDTWLIDNVLDINSGGTVGKPIVWDGSLWGTGANAIIQANSDGAASPKYTSLCHIAGCKYLTIQNITFDGNGKNRFGIVIGGSSAYGPTAQNDERYITIQDCSVLNFGTGAYYCLGILVQTWVNDIYNITIQRNTVNGVGAEAISIYGGRSDVGAQKRETHDCYIGYNTCTNFGRSGSLGEGIQINNRVTNVIVEHNTITTGANGSGKGMTIEANEPDAAYFPTNITYRYNRVTMTTEQCFECASGRAITCKVYYNIFHSTANTTLPTISIQHSSWVGALFEFYNNTIINYGLYGFTCDSDTQEVVIFKNNAMYRYAVTTDAIFNIHLHAGQTIRPVIHSNNLYYRSSGTRWGYIDNSASLFVADMATYEPTAIVTDPLFATNFTDFHLQSGSPAINAGVDVGLTEDYDGNPIVGNPDIGCMEYQPTTTTTTTTI